MLEIISFPSDILRKKSQPVVLIDKHIQQFIDDMLKTMYHNNGVGLAAVQVGKLDKIIVIDMQEFVEDGEEFRPNGFYPLHIVNPIIVKESVEQSLAREGCLSLPEQSIEVQRAAKITVQYLDYFGNTQVLNTDGWLARTIQHEIDHLEGRLLIDYLSMLKKDSLTRKLTKLKKINK